MYFIKRALKYIKNKKGKTLLLGIIFLIIANFILAGLLVYNATVKAQEQTRISIGADVNYIIDFDGIIEDSERGVLNNNDISVIKSAFSGGIITSEKLTQKGSPTYSNIMKVVDSEYVASYDFSISFEAEIEELDQYSQDTTVNPSNHTFDIKLFEALEPLAFKNKNAQLIEGRFATIKEIQSGANKILIEENIASINNLQIGDTITMTTSMLDYQDVDIDCEIIGIYQANEEVDQRMVGKGGNSLLPQNRIYAPFNIVSAIGLNEEEKNNLLITSNVISLKDPLYTDAYKKETEDKLEFKYGRLDANDDLYNSLMGPIKTLGTIARIMVIIIIVAGASIIGLITALTVNERKEEIGIMLAVGESKIKIVTQFAIEVIIIAIIAFILSSFTGSIIGEKISTAVLESDIVQSNESKAKQKNAKLLEEKEIDISVDIDVLVELFSLGLLLSIISTIIPSLYVMRFNPKQILMNRT